MKIGFSFGRCIRDIVTDEVSIDDVVLIVARTKIPDEEQLIEVCNHYAYDTFHGLDLDKCIAVALTLFNNGKIHQPRLYNSFRVSVPEEFVWMDLMPTVTDMTPAVKDAWDHYILMISLCSNKTTPDISDAPMD